MLFARTGLKKVMWPLFIGLQVVKTMLLAMFLPSIIGSVGKILGKGKRPECVGVDGWMCVPFLNERFLCQAYRRCPALAAHRPKP